MRFALTLVVETKKRQIQICLLVTETPQQPQQLTIAVTCKTLACTKCLKLKLFVLLNCLYHMA